MSSLLLPAALLLIAPPAVPAVTPPAASLATPLAMVASAAASAAQAKPADPAVAPSPQTAPASPDNDDLVVTARRHDREDPLESVNVESFALTQAVDNAVIRPMATTYQKALPSPVRDGIRNFLNNLREPVIFLNFMLQLKPGRATETLGRFVVNSTVGIGGVIDVARRRPFKLKHYPNGFADTLGFYGVKTGAFLYVPLVGPTTVRDLIGSTVDRFMLPFFVGGPFKNPAITLPLGVAGTLDHRAQFDETLEALRRDKQKAYQASREFYLARRQAEIDELRGNGHRTVRPNPGSVKPLILEDPSPK